MPLVPLDLDNMLIGYAAPSRHWALRSAASPIATVEGLPAAAEIPPGGN
ncbi:hypothetical protein [Micromonospora sp. MA102]|nr:hypothetical protein [Micromonospora sp. MA102]